MKSLSGKAIAAIAGGIGAVAAVVVALVLIFSDKGYRTIKIYDLVGTSKVTRGSETLDAVVNMTLKSGDRVKVDRSSTLYIKLDEDKYLMGEQGTTFSLEATGTKADSKTQINLEYGTLTNDIRESLSKDSSYRVETPNAVMAVRGTFFIAEYYRDDNGEYVTRVTVHSGKVETWVKNEKGELSKESVIVSAGQQEEIRTFRSVEEMQEFRASSNEVMVIVMSERAIMEPHSIVYDDETREELEFFYESIKAGLVPVGTTKEYVEYLLFGGDEPAPTEEPAGTSGSKGDGIGTDDDGTGDDSGVTGGSDGDDAGTEPESTPGPEPKATPTPAPAASSDADASNADAAPAEPTPTPAPEQKPPVPEPEPTTTYTVTFMSGATVFATRQVEEGSTASQPVLMPTAAGHWDFDFSQEILEDTTINWIDEG